MVGRIVAMDTLKRKASESDEIGRNVVAKLNHNMDASTAATLPQPKSLLQAVRRSRRNNDLPPNPTSLTDLVIPDSFKLINEEIFLLHDSGPGPPTSNYHFCNRTKLGSSKAGRCLSMRRNI